jgi:homoserine/homoserine lactone efflux protein
MTLLTSLSLGPAVFVVLSLAVQRGLRAGLAGVLGITTGNAGYLLLSAAGLTALLRASPRVFDAACLAGAAYLVFLGIQALRSRRSRTADSVTRSGGSFAQALSVQLSNPKAVLYWGALLPQFMDPARAALPQVTMLGAIAISIDMAVMSAYCSGAAAFRDKVLAGGFAHWLDRIAGCFFVVAGVVLATTRIHWSWAERG